MNSYTKRNCSLPECHLVPRTKFAAGKHQNPVYLNVQNCNHQQYLSRLAKITTVLLRPEVDHDRALLSRIIYRNHNQHQTALYFRRLHELRRALRILDQCKIQHHIRQILVSKKNNKEWQSLPCQYHVTSLVCRFREIQKLVMKLRDICQQVYDDFRMQVAQALFMPLAMTVMGVTARLRLVFGVWQRDMADVCELLVKWVPYLPACPDSLKEKTKKSKLLPKAQENPLSPPPPMPKKKKKQITVDTFMDDDLGEPV